MSQKKNIEAIYPLSPMQKGMLFHTLYDPQASLYFEQFTFCLDGRIDETAFHKAWQAVVDRYAVLRTAFVWEKQEEPLQIVLAEATLPWQLLDWRQIGDQDQALADYLADERKHPFDLKKAPLARGTLIRLAETRYRFIWSNHHLLLDGWSLPLLLKDVFIYYESFRTGQTAQLPATRPFQEYIAWLQKQDTAVAAAFWKEQLAGIEHTTPLVDLLGQSNAAKKETAVYHETSLTLSAETSQQLQQIARQHKLTLSTLLLGAWALLLHRYSGEDDVVFGTTISNRPEELADIETMVGLFINSVPMRVRIDAAATLLDWLQTVQTQQVELRSHAYLSLNDIQEQTAVARGSQLFESLFVFENYPLDNDQLRAANLSFSLDDFQAQERTNYPLTIVARPGNQITLQLIYDAQAFTAVTIDRILGHFQTALSHLPAHSSQKAVDLPILSEAESNQLLYEWNQTSTDYPRHASVTALFSQQVSQQPDKIALKFNEQTVTYAELNGRANQLAHYLQQIGLKPGDLVGLSLPRSVELVVAILAILKAGGAYLPLDSEYPKEHLAFMLSDSATPILLTVESFVPALPAYNGRMLLIDKENEQIANQPNTDLPNQTGPESLIYTMYTSGSTGRPKGTLISHRNVIRLVKNNSFVPISADDNFLLYAPISFDASTLELWGALLNGATLVVFPEKTSSTAKLGQLLRQEKITILWLTAGLFHVMVDEQLDDLKLVRHVLAGGDVLSVPHVKRLLAAQTEGQSVINGYGPTENTTFTCCYPMTQSSAISHTVPIGRPIANSTVYILDAAMRPVPVGVPGELYTGGDGVGQGYLNQPELTAVRFVPDPFSQTPGAKLYRTGDMVRYLPDGNIEFLGRQDNQVKIRGFRIELGEIETVLAEHPAVREAVVIAWQNRAGAKQIIAYFTSARRIPPSLRELERFLKQRLPDYMLPKQFFVLESIPLTENGKVNRKALPTPEVQLQTESLVPPRNETEQTLADIWTAVLALDKVGIHNNFFELGGDSILCIQLVARAAQAGLHFTPKLLFQHPTIAELAPHVSSKATIQAEQTAVTGPVPLTPIQHWLFAQSLPEPHHFNQSFLLVEREHMNPALVELAVNYLVEHHDALRLQYRQEGGQWQQSIAAPGKPVPFTIVDLSQTADEQLTAVLEQHANQAQASLRFSDDLLLRCLWFDCGPQRPARFLWVVHHLLVDGISWRLLLQDLQTAYNQLAQNQQPNFPAKTSSYKQWANILQEKVPQNSDLLNDLPYWQAVLQQPSAQLSVDFAAGISANTEATVAEVAVSLTAVETRALLHDLPKLLQTETNDVLLTALVQGLAPWLEFPALRIDLEGHGRVELFDGIDLSRTVGWFTSIYPVRLDLRQANNNVEALKIVKEQLRQIPHQGVSYNWLHYLAADSVGDQLRASQPTAVRFNYMGQYDQGFGEGVTLIPAQESAGRNLSPQTPRTHLLDIAGGVVREQLWFTWMYSTAVYKAETVEKMAQNFIDALRRIIAQEENAPVLTPSDFPSANLDQGALDQFLTLIGQGDQ